MNNYWLVGASWNGTEHQDERFVEGGFWMLGWSQEDQPHQYKKASEMKSGDKIAIKRMKGQGQSGIRIKHFGIIQEVILDSNRVICTVNWIARNVDLDIEESRGCFKSIHGPFTRDHWIESIFCI